MYIENKSRGVQGEGRIGRVTFSRSGRSVYYRSLRLESLGGRGFKANYFDVETRDEYWVSGPRRDGCDRLYGGVVEIDEDVRDEYWTQIREVAHNRHLGSYRC